jgi:cell division protein FtsQ
MSRLTARGVDRVAPSKRRTRPAKSAAPTRRKAKPRKKSRTRRGSLLTRLQVLPWKIVAGLVFILSTGFGGGYYWVSGRAAVLIGETQQVLITASVRAGLTVQEIFVEGRSQAPSEALLAALGIARGDPILLVDPADAKARLETLGWVATAVVERHLPDTIYVRLRERRPLAVWQSERVHKLVDTSGAVIDRGDVARFSHLPHIVGEGAPARLPILLRALANEPVLALRLSAANWVGERRWTLHFDERVKVSLPEGPVGPSLDRLGTLQRLEAVLDSDIISLDLRQADRATVRLPPGAQDGNQKNDDKTAAGGSDA